MKNDDDDGERSRDIISMRRRCPPLLFISAAIPILFLALIYYCDGFISDKQAKELALRFFLFCDDV